MENTGLRTHSLCLGWRYIHLSFPFSNFISIHNVLLANCAPHVHTGEQTCSRQRAELSQDWGVWHHNYTLSRVSIWTLKLNCLWLAQDSFSPARLLLFKTTTTLDIKSKAFRNKYQVWLFVCFSLQLSRRARGLVPHVESSHSGPCCRTLYIWWTLQWGKRSIVWWSSSFFSSGLVSEVVIFL